MTKGPLIGKGRTADIFSWGDDRVLKLFHSDRQGGEAEYEARIARAVHASGARSPALLDVVEVEGRHGLVYERIRGLSLAALARSSPWQLPRLARAFARLHASIHKRHAPGLPSQRERIVRKITAAAPLSGEVKEVVLQRMSHLPDWEGLGGEIFLCHGDFHPENVIMSPRGPVAIDWIDATQGNPLADVARTLLIVRAAPLSLPKSPATIPLRLLVAAFHTLYLRYYIEATGASRKKIDAWLSIVAAARLEEGIADEEAYLLKIASSPSR